MKASVQILILLLFGIGVLTLRPNICSAQITPSKQYECLQSIMLWERFEREFDWIYDPGNFYTVIDGDTVQWNSVIDTLTLAGVLPPDERIDPFTAVPPSAENHSSRIQHYRDAFSGFLKLTYPEMVQKITTLYPAISTLHQSRLRSLLVWGEEDDSPFYTSRNPGAFVVTRRTQMGQWVYVLTPTMLVGKLLPSHTAGLGVPLFLTIEEPNGVWTRAIVSIGASEVRPVGYLHSAGVGSTFDTLNGIELSEDDFMDFQTTAVYFGGQLLSFDINSGSELQAAKSINEELEHLLNQIPNSYREQVHAIAELTRGQMEGIPKKQGIETRVAYAGTFRDAYQMILDGPCKELSPAMEATAKACSIELSRTLDQNRQILERSDAKPPF